MNSVFDTSETICDQYSPSWKYQLLDVVNQYPMWMQLDFVSWGHFSSLKFKKQVKWASKFEKHSRPMIYSMSTTQAKLGEEDDTSNSSIITFGTDGHSYMRGWLNMQFIAPAFADDAVARYDQ